MRRTKPAKEAEKRRSAPDLRRTVFSKEAERQAMLLRGRAEEKEALEFIDAVLEWPKR
jgi:hypothetical protein